MGKNEKLKPCPFCGKAPRVFIGDNTGEGFVECWNGMCHVQPGVRGSTQAEAQAAWNTRATQPNGEGDQDA